jgi:uncharacterized Zn ribbon protein
MDGRFRKQDLDGNPLQAGESLTLIQPRSPIGVSAASEKTGTVIKKTTSGTVYRQAVMRA